MLSARTGDLHREMNRRWNAIRRMEEAIRDMEEAEFRRRCEELEEDRRLYCEWLMLSIENTFPLLEVKKLGLLFEAAKGAAEVVESEGAPQSPSEQDVAGKIWGGAQKVGEAVLKK